MSTHLPELTTIRDFMRYAVSQFNAAGLFFGHGTDNAWDEAVSLVLHSLHLPHDINPNLLAAHLTQAERDQILNLINDRTQKRIPLPYLTNEAWFSQLPFYVDERVLIPRSPIAELIERQFAPWIDPEQVHTILDLCTGSGCIAITAALHFPEAHVVACDLSPDALAVAKINVLRHDVADQVALYESDLFTAIPKQTFDIIVSNPPYVSEEEMEELPSEYHHEPRLGLAAENDGIDIAERILKEAGQWLSPHGILVVEVGNSEFTLADAYPHIPFTWVEFERGGGGVFILTAEQVKAFC